MLDGEWVDVEVDGEGVDGEVDVEVGHYTRVLRDPMKLRFHPT